MVVNKNSYIWIYIPFQNNIPVFSPALTDGSLGDMIYFHSFKNPGLVLDIVEGKNNRVTEEDHLSSFGLFQLCVWLSFPFSDIRRLNSMAVFAKKTGMIILGGGLVKHHIANANLMVRPLWSLAQSFLLSRWLLFFSWMEQVI